MPQGDTHEKERKITTKEKHDEAYYRRKGWFSALPEGIKCQTLAERQAWLRKLYYTDEPCDWR